MREYIEVDHEKVAGIETPFLLIILFAAVTYICTKIYDFTLFNSGIIAASISLVITFSKEYIVSLFIYVKNKVFDRYQ